MSDKIGALWVCCVKFVHGSKTGKVKCNVQQTNNTVAVKTRKAIEQQLYNDYRFEQSWMGATCASDIFMDATPSHYHQHHRIVVIFLYKTEE